VLRWVAALVVGSLLLLVVCAGVNGFPLRSHYAVAATSGDVPVKIRECPTSRNFMRNAVNVIVKNHASNVEGVIGVRKNSLKFCNTFFLNVMVYDFSTMVRRNDIAAIGTFYCFKYIILRQRVRKNVFPGYISHFPSGRLAGVSNTRKIHDVSFDGVILNPLRGNKHYRSSLIFHQIRSSIRSFSSNYGGNRGDGRKGNREDQGANLNYGRYELPLGNSNRLVRSIGHTPLLAQIGIFGGLGALAQSFVLAGLLLAIFGDKPHRWRLVGGFWLAGLGLFAVAFWLAY